MAMPVCVVADKQREQGNAVCVCVCVWMGSNLFA